MKLLQIVCDGWLLLAVPQLAFFGWLCWKRSAAERRPGAEWWRGR